MGSAQRADAFDGQALAAAGIDLAERRSGGGAVFIEPDGCVWIDVLAPHSSPWWNDDLGATFMRVGRCWSDALVGFGVEAELYVEPPVRSDDARLVCWAGLGWGEVVVDGAKVVGLSQRRTRWGARIQGMAVIDGSADRAADWFADVEPARQAELRAAVGSVQLGVDRAALERAVVDALISAH